MIKIPEELYEKLKGNKRILLETLVKNPDGLDSGKLTQITGISNKGDTLKHIKDKLEKYKLKILIERSSGREHRWKLCEI